MVSASLLNAKGRDLVIFLKSQTIPYGWAAEWNHSVSRCDARVFALDQGENHDVENRSISNSKTLATLQLSRIVAIGPVFQTMWTDWSNIISATWIIIKIIISAVFIFVKEQPICSGPKSGENVHEHCDKIKPASAVSIATSICINLQRSIKSKEPQGNSLSLISSTGTTTILFITEIENWVLVFIELDLKLLRYRKRLRDPGRVSGTCLTCRIIYFTYFLSQCLLITHQAGIHDEAGENRMRARQEEKVGRACTMGGRTTECAEATTSQAAGSGQWLKC